MNLLMHICCAPCSIYSLRFFREKGYNIEGYFFNPNIHPYREYSRRVEALEALAEEEGLPLKIDRRYLVEDFLRMVVNRQEERCLLCYELRLSNTAERAVQAGISSFSTTLLISPFQKHDLVKQVGESVAGRYGLQFVYEDLRDGFKESVRMARRKGLYVQGYCGCIYSEKERYAPPGS